jgi:acyl carrier protein
MAQKRFTSSDLKNLLVNRIGVSKDLVSEDRDAKFEDMGLDSVALVNLQLAMNQQYGLTIPDADAQSITTVGKAVDYVNGRLQKQP